MRWTGTSTSIYWADLFPTLAGILHQYTNPRSAVQVTRRINYHAVESFAICSKRILIFYRRRQMSKYKPEV